MQSAGLQARVHKQPPQPAPVVLQQGGTMPTCPPEKYTSFRNAKACQETVFHSFKKLLSAHQVQGTMLGQREYGGKQDRWSPRLIQFAL